MLFKARKQTGEVSGQIPVRYNLKAMILHIRTMEHRLGVLELYESIHMLHELERTIRREWALKDVVST